MRFVRWIVAAVVFVALLFLSLQNSENGHAPVLPLRAAGRRRWSSWCSSPSPAGVAAGLLAGALRATRLKRQLSRLRREQRAAAPRRDAVAAPGTGRGRGRLTRATGYADGL